MKRQTPSGFWHMQRGGFTLVELMIAVAIIAILAAFLAPSVSTFMRRGQGKTAARDVANTFRMAHNQAMSRGEVILAEITVHGGENDAGEQVTGGRIELYRTTNNAMAQCNPANANFNPTNSACFAMSCAQAQGFGRVSVHNFDLSQTSPDMMILAMDPDEDSRFICFSPNGRVLDTTGLPIESEDAGCDATNLRLFVRSLEDGADTTNPLGDTALDACVGAVAADGEVIDTGAKARQEQKDGRDITNFYSIHLPFNGAVSITQ